MPRIPYLPQDLTEPSELASAIMKHRNVHELAQLLFNIEAFRRLDVFQIDATEGPGWPWQDEVIALMLHKANVSYELHGWGPRQFTPALKKEIAGRMQDRIMFGCDFPVLRYEKVVADWHAQGYTEQVLKKVLCGNAEAYFGAA